MKNKVLKNNKDLSKGEIVIYRAKDGSAKLEVRLEEETIWLTLNQMALLFDIDKSGTSRHINNIFDSRELEEKSTVAKIATVQKEGKREVVREIDFYNLDMIISVGYRVNSKRATDFRIWTTQVLRKYIVNGVAINKKRLQDRQINLKELEDAINLLQATMASKMLTGGEAKGLLKVITEYANSWLLLNKYDAGKIKVAKGKTKGIKILDYEFVEDSIEKLKFDLIKKKQASDLFGRENSNRLEAILNSISQSFGGKALYPSLEEKAAHLLYFIFTA